MYSFDKKFLHLKGNKPTMKRRFLLHTLQIIQYVHRFQPLLIPSIQLYRTAENAWQLGILQLHLNKQNSKITVRTAATSPSLNIHSNSLRCLYLTDCSNIQRMYVVLVQLGLYCFFLLKNTIPCPFQELHPCICKVYMIGYYMLTLQWCMLFHGISAHQFVFCSNLKVIDNLTCTKISQYHNGIPPPGRLCCHFARH